VGRFYLSGADCGDDLFDAHCETAIRIDDYLGLRDWLEAGSDLFVEFWGTVRCDVLAEIGGETPLRGFSRAMAFDNPPRYGNCVGEVGDVLKLGIPREDAAVDENDLLGIILQQVSRRLDHLFDNQIILLRRERDAIGSEHRMAHDVFVEDRCAKVFCYSSGQGRLSGSGQTGEDD
jgi:hypothetical protein